MRSLCVQGWRKTEIKILGVYIERGVGSDSNYLYSPMYRKLFYFLHILGVLRALSPEINLIQDKI